MLDVIRRRVARPPAALAKPNALVALVAYAGLGLALFGSPLFHAGAHECLCIGSTTDAGVYVWAFEWWPHALLHGLNPFFTHIVYAPQGINLAHGALVPGAALILAPVTAVAGPLFSFNLAMLLSPVLAAFFAFLLARRITRSFWASFVGGWLFGFSTYMLGQLAGHLNLTLVFLVPAIIHLVLRGLSGEVGRRPFAVLLTIALVLQFSFSTEVFASMTFFGAIALGVTFLLGDSSQRNRLRELLLPLALAYLATGVLVSPYLYYALQPGGASALPWRSELFSNDLLGFVVPTEITQIGGTTFTPTSAKFTASFVEGGAYLGIPVIVIAALGARGRVARLGVKVMLGMLLVLVVCTLGGHLHLAGRKLLPLPWWIAERLPVLGAMLPSRFALYIVLIVSLLAATWLARARLPALSLLLAVLALASVWPAVERRYWRSSPDVPRLFTTTAYRHAITSRDIALVLPIGIAGQSMLWQAEAHLGFHMASGYVGAPVNPYQRFAIYPTLTYGAVIPHVFSAAATFLADEHITVVVLDARAAAGSAWVPVLEHLGWGPTSEAGVMLFRHNGFIAEPTQPSAPPLTPQAFGPPTAQRAAHRAADEYLRAVSAGDALRACTVMTAEAQAAQAQSHQPNRTVCARAFSALMRRVGFIRSSARVLRAGPATIHGGFGYVELAPVAGGQESYLPVREIGGRWYVNGAPVPAPSSGRRSSSQPAA